MDKTVLIEQTSKRLKRWELVATAILFLTLFAGFGLLYVAIPAAVAAWSLSGVCLLAFIGVYLTPISYRPAISPLTKAVGDRAIS